MNALVPIAPKLVPLVRMLGSPVDGEVLAACRAIGRTLDTAGMDFHDLADVVERAALPVVVEQHKPEPAPALKPWQITAMHCIRAGQGSLKPAELDFFAGHDPLARQAFGQADQVVVGHCLGARH